MTENSINAIRASSAAGLNAVELDVRVSTDGVTYLFHDEEFNNRPILAMEYAELKTIAGEAAIPTLSEVLSVSPFDGIFVLDLKQINNDGIDHIVQTVENSTVKLEQIIFQSDDKQVLFALYQKLPTGRYYILERLKRRFPFFFKPNANRVAAGIPADYIEGVSFKGRSFIDEPFVRTFKDAGFRVFVWTINDESGALYYENIGVDGLITDVPLDVLRIFGRGSQGARSCKRSTEVQSH